MLGVTLWTVPWIWCWREHQAERHPPPSTPSQASAIHPAESRVSPPMEQHLPRLWRVMDMVRSTLLQGEVLSFQEGIPKGGFLLPSQYQVMGCPTRGFQHHIREPTSMARSWQGSTPLQWRMGDPFMGCHLLTWSVSMLLCCKMHPPQQ